VASCGGCTSRCSQEINGLRRLSRGVLWDKSSNSFASSSSHKTPQFRIRSESGRHEKGGVIHGLIISAGRCLSAANRSPQNEPSIAWRAPAHADPLPPLPGSGKIGMGQSLALVAIQQNDVSGFSLLFQQCRRRPIRSTSAAIWRPFSVLLRTSPTILFSRALDNCERLMRTLSRLGAQPGDCPVGPIGNGFDQQGYGHAQGRLARHWRSAGRHSGL